MLTTGTVAATLLLVALAAGGSYLGRQSQLAFLRIDTDRPPLVAEVTDREGNQPVPRATVPMQQPSELPAGEYRVRLMASARLSQDYDVSLTPRGHLSPELNLDDQLLWGNTNYRRAFAPVIVRDSASPSEARTDLIFLNPDGIERRDGRTGMPVWSLDLLKPTHEQLVQASLRWPWDGDAVGTPSGLGEFEMRPMVVSSVEPMLDLDGDGASDFVLAMRHQACLVAVRGTDGTPLWLIQRDIAEPATRPRWHGPMSAVLHQPLIVADQDGDGVPELAVWFAAAQADLRRVTRTLELVSGKTGTTLWRYEPPAEYFALSAGEEVPHGVRWFSAVAATLGAARDRQPLCRQVLRFRRRAADAPRSVARLGQFSRLGRSAAPRLAPRHPRTSTGPSGAALCRHAPARHHPRSFTRSVAGADVAAARAGAGCRPRLAERSAPGAGALAGTCPRA